MEPQDQHNYTKLATKVNLYATFFIENRLYGIEVKKVQEIVRTMPITKVPLAPQCVHGLINLRGQIATAIGLRELFGLAPQVDTEKMNVVCVTDSGLVSLLVDRIGDVIEVGEDIFESTPDTISEDVKKFMQGVYKTSGQLLSVLNIDDISKYLNSH